MVSLDVSQDRFVLRMESFLYLICYSECIKLIYTYNVVYVVHYEYPDHKTLPHSLSYSRHQWCISILPNIHLRAAVVRLFLKPDVSLLLLQ